MAESIEGLRRAEDRSGVPERELVLASMAELLRSHRQMMESMRRIARDVERLRTRLGVEMPAAELAPRRSETDSAAGIDEPMVEPPSEEALLRDIASAVRKMSRGSL